MHKFIEYFIVYKIKIINIVYKYLGPTWLQELKINLWADIPTPSIAPPIPPLFELYKTTSANFSFLNQKKKNQLIKSINYPLGKKYFTKNLLI